MTDPYLDGYRTGVHDAKWGIEPRDPGTGTMFWSGYSDGYTDVLEAEAYTGAMEVQR